ncbi:hypothetical protein AEYBE204_12085 [Asticcacaulis sp. YBE204]|nr:hypothetical protein AEYBE204_12085 [Asticcacaulis sp. YBE204]
MTTMTSKSPDLNQFAAAELTGMSPELLEWLTKHAPKTGENRKLKLLVSFKGQDFTLKKSC